MGVWAVLKSLPVVLTAAKVENFWEVRERGFFGKVTRKSCLEENVFDLGLGLKSERPKSLHFCTAGAKTSATQR